MRTRGNSAGFTLIELIVVIAILATIAVAVMPSLRSMGASSDYRDALSAIRRVASEARETAIRSGQATELVYEESANVLRIERSQEDGTSEAVREYPLTADLAPQRYQLEGRDTAATEFRLVFTPDGKSNGGGIEFANFSIAVDQNGAYRYIDGPLPNPEDERWQAGELEQRL